MVCKVKYFQRVIELVEYACIPLGISQLKYFHLATSRLRYVCPLEKILIFAINDFRLENYARDK